MKIVKLQDGLGNQMFQYAFGKLIHADFFDISWFDEVKNQPNWTVRSYQLNFWNCHVDIIDKKSMLNLRKNNPFLKIFGIKTKLKTILENSVNVYEPKLLLKKKGVFKGYFQCVQYCTPIRKKLLKDFTPHCTPNKRNKEILKSIQSTNSVSLHIRRGDYLKLQHVYNRCDLDYYQKAIDFIASKVESPHFFLFSDDISWVRKNLKLHFPYTIVDFNRGKNSAWDIWLMKNCQHNIIPNSSFSWWGAWLNENPKKIVVAPKMWFTSGKKTDTIPRNWKKL